MKTANFTRINIATEKVIDGIKKNANSDDMMGLKSGFTNLDKSTYGWQNGELIIISGRPAMGKTAFILSMVVNMSIKDNIPVAVFSLEDTESQLVSKIISNCCEIDSRKIKNGVLTIEEQRELDFHIKRITDAEIYIDCSPRLQIQDLCTKSRELAEKKGVKALFIDYVQLLTVTDKYTENRYNEINFISRELKALAKELDIPVFVISQMNRNAETDKDRLGFEGRRPRLSDLRDSGTLCDDADVVCFIFRPEYYNLTEDAQGNSLIGIAEIIVAKNRNGYETVQNLNFKGKYCLFKEITKEFSPYEFLDTKLNSESDETPF